MFENKLQQLFISFFLAFVFVCLVTLCAIPGLEDVMSLQENQKQLMEENIHVVISMIHTEQWPYSNYQ